MSCVQGVGVRRRVGVRAGSRWLGWLALALAALAVFAARSEAAPDWKEPKRLVAVDGPARELSLAVNDAGAAVLAWVERGDLRVATKAAPDRRWHASPRRFRVATRPQVAIDERGMATLAWEHFEGADFYLQAAVGRIGRGFGAAVPISGPLGEAQGRWQLAANRRGDRVLVWDEYRSQDFHGRPLNVYYPFAAAMSSRAQAWTAPVQLSASPALASGVGLDAEGDAWAAWRSYGPAPGIVAIRAAHYSGGSWGAEIGLSTAGEPAADTRPTVLVGPSGIAFVGWQASSGECTPGETRLRAAAFLPGLGAWSAPAGISRPGECLYEPRFAIGSSGGVDAVWTSVAKDKSYLMASSTMRADLNWGPPWRVAKIGAKPAGWEQCTHLCPGPPLAFPSLAVRGSAAVLAWLQPEAGLRAAFRPPRSFSSVWDPELLSRWSRAGSPVVAVDRLGEGLVVWPRKDAIMFSVTSRGAGWPTTS